MATYKEEAVVLRAYDLGEADRIISLITAGRGLRRAVAKGLKRTKSKFGGRLEPFTHIQALLYEGRNLDTITQVDVVRSHAPIRDDFAKYVYGAAMLEMVDKSLHENQNIPRLFDALCVSLRTLEGDISNPALLLSAFQLKVCALIGYHPHLEECLHCGGAVGEGGIFMDLAGGGIACENCRRGLERTIPLTPRTLELIRKLLKTDMATISKWDENSRTCRDILGISFLFSESFLERPLKSRQVVFSHLQNAKKVDNNT
ncbi:MAG: DNA repair protein RecO [Actinomycetota bacterium]|nr:DNA repair protein RecO [Actinomycetota bacterium]